MDLLIEGPTSAGFHLLYDQNERPQSGIAKLGDGQPIVFGYVVSNKGDVLELIDSEGSPFGHYTYDPYGKPLAAEARATNAVALDMAQAIVEQQPLRFAGYVWDDFLDLYYVGARYYDPTQMRFITKDPEDADGEQSPYMYCEDNPVETTDPEGLWGHHSLHGMRTRTLAEQAGFKRKFPNSGKATDPPFWRWGKGWSADKIALGDWRMDVDPEYRAKSRHSKYHWWILGADWFGLEFYYDALYHWRSGNRAKSYSTLGRALHCFQDSWGHDRALYHDAGGYYWEFSIGSPAHHPKPPKYPYDIDTYPPEIPDFSYGRENTTEVTKTTLRLFRDDVGLD